MPKFNVPPAEDAPDYTSPLDSKLNNQMGLTAKEKSFYAFQRFKKYGLVVLILIFFCVPFLWIGSQLTAKKPVPTPLAAVSLPGAVTTEVAASSVKRNSAFLDCYALADINLGDKLALAGSKVPVGGFTFSRGGLVSVAGVWIPQGLVRCDGGDLRSVEMPYYPTVTPTRLPTLVLTATSSPAPAVTVTPIYIRIRETAIPLPTYTPGAVVSSEFVVNGLYFDHSGCLVVSVYNVREIYVNEKPAAGGSTYCDVKSFRVVVR